MTPSPIVETERLSLRRLTPADAGLVLELLNDPSFLRNIGDRGVRTLADAARYILDGPMASYRRHGFGLWLVETKVPPAPIGICGLLKRDALPEPDLGYALLPRFWGRGYASEAAAAVLRHARSVLGLPRLLAVTNPDNAGSVRVLEKLGFRHERTVRLADGEPEVLLFAVEVSIRPHGHSSMTRREA